jgi:hypothetical protein
LDSGSQSKELAEEKKANESRFRDRTGNRKGSSNGI